jgi:hypothetical protein
MLDFDACGEYADLCRTLERELAAVTRERDTLRAELAEARRQVEVLSAACSSHALIGTNMAGTASEWRAWAAQQAKGGAQ